MSSATKWQVRQFGNYVRASSYVHLTSSHVSMSTASWGNYVRGTDVYVHLATTSFWQQRTCVWCTHVHLARRPFGN